MASMGLAWHQGQKNAQEAARGQMNTILSMANDTVAAEKANEYFSPVQKDLRARQSKNSADKLKALQEIDQIKNEMKANPVAVAEKLLKEKYGTDFTIIQDDKGFHAVANYGDGQGRAQVIDLGETKNQMMKSLLMEKISSTEDLFADYSGKADAEVAARLKSQEKILEETAKAQAQYTYGGQQKINADLQGHRIQAGATIGAAGLGANAQVAAATNAKYHEVAPVIENVAAGTMGFLPVMDTNGKVVDYQKSIVVDGKQSVQRLSEADPATQNRFIDLKQAGQTNFNIKQMKDPATGRVQMYDPTTSAIAAVRQRDAELKQSTLKPTASGLPATETTPTTGSPFGIRVEEGGVQVRDGRYVDPRTGLDRPATEIPFWMPRNED